MIGLTILIKSQIGPLHVTVPIGNANTFVPDGPTCDSIVDFESWRVRFAGVAPSASLWWFCVIGPGTGMFRSWKKKNIINFKRFEMVYFGANLMYFMEIALGKHVSFQQFIEFNYFFGETSCDEDFSFFY